MEWISFDEELPKIDQLIIVSDSEKGVSEAFYMFVTDDKKTIMLNIRAEIKPENSDWNPTHWIPFPENNGELKRGIVTLMPLPKPPKEK